MAGWDDVKRVALSLPETSEKLAWGNRSWRVRDRGFVWERPLRAGERRALGAAAPAGAILGAYVEHLGAKAALLEDAPEVFFTTPHFDGYASILVRLDEIGIEDLTEVIVEAWLARAPKRVAQMFIETELGPRA